MSADVDERLRVLFEHAATAYPRPSVSAHATLIKELTIRHVPGESDDEFQERIRATLAAEHKAEAAARGRSMK